MKKIIFDCDNTVGLEGYPMDDALAFLYLLGNRDKARLLGFCCTFGNGTAAQVYQSSRDLLEETGCTDLPLLRGAEQGEDPISESAAFIAAAANRHPGEVSYLGIGSVTNLYGAYLLDPQIFHKLREVVLMGGITQPLYTHGRHCPELNLSVNAAASAAVLGQGDGVTVITGNNCLPVSYLPKEEFWQRMQVGQNPVGDYVARKCGHRFTQRQAVYGEEGSYCWDAVAAAYLLYPQLFQEVPTRCSITRQHLATGFLAPCPEGSVLLNLPRPRCAQAFRDNLYRSWLSLELPQGGTQPLGAQPLGAQSLGTQSLGAQPLGAQPLGAQSLGAQSRELQ